MPEKYEPSAVIEEAVYEDEEDDDVTELDTSVGPIPVVRVEEVEDVEEEAEFEPWQRTHLPTPGEELDIVEDDRRGARGGSWSGKNPGQLPSQLPLTAR